MKNSSLKISVCIKGINATSSNLQWGQRNTVLHIWGLSRGERQWCWRAEVKQAWLWQMGHSSASSIKTLAIRIPAQTPAVVEWSPLRETSQQTDDCRTRHVMCKDDGVTIETSGCCYSESQHLHNGFIVWEKLRICAKTLASSCSKCCLCLRNWWRSS